jgi:antitoxin ParD1/3/4
LAWEHQLPYLESRQEWSMSRHYALSPAEEAFAEELVGSGRYRSVDEVVREALRILKEHEPFPALDLDALRRLWRKGAESGVSVSAEDVFDRLEAKYEAMARDRGL